MKIWFTLILGIWFAGQSSAQSRSWIRQLDSNLFTLPNPYLVQDSLHTPLNKGDLQEKVDPFNIDQEKLNAALFEAINERRSRRFRKPLRYHEKLDKLAFLYCSQLHRAKFKPTKNNTKRMERYLYLASKNVGFELGYTSAVTHRVSLINFEASRDYFYYSRDVETDLHLFYGSYQQTKDSSAILRPLPLHTYESLAQSIVDQVFIGKDSRKLTAKTYSYLACWVYPIEKSIGGRSIPSAKLMIVFGGSRLAGIEE